MDRKPLAIAAIAVLDVGSSALGQNIAPGPRGILGQNAGIRPTETCLRAPRLARADCIAAPAHRVAKRWWRTQWQVLSGEKEVVLPERIELSTSPFIPLPLSRPLGLRAGP